MLKLIRTNSENIDFQELVQLLDQDLRVRDGEDHEVLAQLNYVAVLPYALVAYQHGKPVACGAFQAYTSELVEVKRIFVLPEFRGQGIAQAVLLEVEGWAQQEGYSGYVLETGRNQPEAIRLYERNGYQRVANFGKYIGVENSVCMQKAAGTKSLVAS